MKFKTTGADGVEVEVEASTQEEVDAKIAAEKATLEENHKKEIEGKDASVNTLAKEKSDLEAKIAKMELEGIKDDHPNFKVLKDALAKKDSEITTLRTDLENDKKSRKEEAMNNAVKKATRGNEELEKKVKLHLEKTLTGLPDGTEEERTVKLLAALKLSAEGEGGPGMFDNGTGGGDYGAGPGADNTNKVEFTSREKALGKKLGITDEDYKKYGPRLGKK